MSFSGRYTHAIDDKGRLIVPSRLREELAEPRLLLMPSPDRCITVWSGEERKEYEQKLQSQGKSSAENRAIIRELYASSHSDEVDKQNRISIPDELRTFMGIDREVVILGAGDHIEIWDPQLYAEHRGQVAEVGLAAMFEKLDI